MVAISKSYYRAEGGHAVGIGAEGGHAVGIGALWDIHLTRVCLIAQVVGSISSWKT